MRTFMVVLGMAIVFGAAGPALAAPADHAAPPAHAVERGVPWLLGLLGLGGVGGGTHGAINPGSVGPAVSGSRRTMAVPEPSTLALLGLAAAPVIARRLRKRS